MREKIQLKVKANEIDLTTVLLPYRTISELPSQFKALPTNAKRIAMNVINSVLKGGGSEESAFRQAWGAIKKSYHKVGDNWIKK